MINLKQELQNYPAIDLESISRNITDIPDNIRNSIILYNKAVDNLHAKNEDISIIELKKAISMNPGFHEAMNLLGLCYMYTKEYTKASEIFEKVVKAENNSIKALRYLEQLGGEYAAEQSSGDRQGSPVKRLAKSETEVAAFGEAKKFISFQGSSLRTALKFGAVFIAGVIVTILISIPLHSTVQKPADEAAAKPDSTAAGAETKKPADDGSKALKEDIRKLTGENERLKNELAQANMQLSYTSGVMKLYEADRLAASGDYEGAGDRLVMLKGIGFKESEKAKFDALYSSVMPRAAWKAFTDGGALIQSKKYQDALNKLSKIPVYGSDWAYMDITLYYIGNCYKELNDSRNAVASYEKLKTSYPKSQYAQYADYRIKELTAVP